MKSIRKSSRVVVFQKTLPHYRVPFFEQLRSQCHASGIELVLIVGDGIPGEKERLALSTISWAHQFKNWNIRLGNKFLVFQRGLFKIRPGDLIIVEQAVKLPLNWILLLLHQLGFVLLCFWGHGRNLQSTNPNSIEERIKAWMTKRVHWFFAYNERSKKIVEQIGFPSERITCVMNAIDTSQLQKFREEILVTETKSSLREKLGIQGKTVGLYCGGLYPEKLPQFLLDSADELKKSLQDFELIVIGTGECLPLLQKTAESRPWIRLPGAVFGEQKARYYLAADFVLNPGLVGLAILDAFALGCIFATTKGTEHSPEIDYLLPGVNGIMTERDVKSYCSAIVEISGNPSRCDEIRKAAAEFAQVLTISNMGKCFFEGLQKALNEA